MEPKQLREYRLKRNFDVTSEPKGSTNARRSFPMRFVIQRHEASRLHFDLRLEVGGIFKSWAVTKEPSTNPSVKRLAIEVEDHPLEYGSFEGTIPEGAYGAGTVTIWDRGKWKNESGADARSALATGELKFKLEGERLRGGWALVRMKAASSATRKTSWLLIKRHDSFAESNLEDGVKKANPSNKSSKVMDEDGHRPLKSMRRRESMNSSRLVLNSKKSKAEKLSTDSIQVLSTVITHPDKTLWPAANHMKAVTKADLAHYIELAGEWMIKHLKGRPCSVLRAPDGINRVTFLQRHAGAGLPKQVRLIKMPGDPNPYIRIDDVDALLALAQLGALEFHPGNGKPGQPAKPDRLVFDLDPDPSLPFSATISAAKEVKERLEQVNLAAFCKASGGKGLHVVSPLRGERGSDPGWDDAKRFARTLCEQMAADSPNRYVTNLSKRFRKDRIFLDYLRNDLMATAIAPLSTRARPGAPVSMPINWAQLRGNLDPARYTIHSALKIFNTDAVWKDYEEAEQPLSSALKRLTLSEV